MKILEYESNYKSHIIEKNLPFNNLYFKYLVCYPKKDNQSYSYTICTDLYHNLFIKNDGTSFNNFFTIEEKDRVSIYVDCNKFFQKNEQELNQIKLHHFLTFLNEEKDKTAYILYNIMMYRLIFLSKNIDLKSLEKLNNDRETLLTNPDDFSLGIAKLIRSRI